MKTYEEMASAVLTRAKAKRLQRRRRVLAAFSAAAVVCLILTAVLLLERDGKGSTATQPRLVLLCEAAEHNEPEPLSAGMVKPLKLLIRVRDLRGITRYRDVVDILAQEAAFREAIWNEEEDKNSDNQYIRWQDENVMVSLLYQGFLYLKVEDYDQIQDVSVYTTESGAATVSRYIHNETWSGGPEKGIGINWVLSDVTVDAISKNPEMKLSDIRDTIRIKVQYKDGTEEIAVIELTVDDEGQIFVSQKGSITSQ